jgi:hypothetical protein
VLSLIDGERDLRAIAAHLGRSEFDAAKVIFGLVSTGVVEIVRPVMAPVIDDAAKAAELLRTAEIEDALERGFAGIRAGSFIAARENLEQFLLLAPDHPEGDRARAALRAMSSLVGALDGGTHA